MGSLKSFQRHDLALDYRLCEGVKMIAEWGDLTCVLKMFINYDGVLWLCCLKDNHKASLRDSPFGELWIANYGR